MTIENILQEIEGLVEESKKLKAKIDEMKKPYLGRIREIREVITAKEKMLKEAFSKYKMPYGIRHTFGEHYVD